MLELSDLHLFIKKNSKIINYKIDYTDDGDIYNYKINIEGIDYIIKLIDDYSNVKMEYNNEIYEDDNDIQLKLFELLNYKNIEYLDCYIKNKLKKKDNNDCDGDNNDYDCYDDDYDNIKNKLVCNRVITTKNKKNMKFKFEFYNNELYMKIDNDNIIGFDNIINKINLII